MIYENFSVLAVDGLCNIWSRADMRTTLCLSNEQRDDLMSQDVARLESDQDDAQFLADVLKLSQEISVGVSGVGDINVDAKWDEMVESITGNFSENVKDTFLSVVGVILEQSSCDRGLVNQGLFEIYECLSDKICVLPPETTAWFDGYREKNSELKCVIN